MEYEYNTKDLIIANNIIYARPTKWAIGTTAQPNSNYMFINNIVFNENSSQSIYNNLSLGWSNSNPLFVNPTENNFNLYANSKAINSAFNVYSETVDFNNNLRNDGVKDIGAIEYDAILTFPIHNQELYLLHPNPVIDCLWISTNQSIKQIDIHSLLVQ